MNSFSVCATLCLYATFILVTETDCSSRKRDGLVHTKSNLQIAQRKTWIHLVKHPESRIDQDLRQRSVSQSVDPWYRNEAPAKRTRLLLMPRHKKKFVGKKISKKTKLKNTTFHKKHKKPKRKGRQLIKSPFKCRSDTLKTTDSDAIQNLKPSERNERKKTDISNERNFSLNNNEHVNSSEISVSRNSNQTKENKAQKEFTEVATKHFIIRIFARDYDHTFDSLENKTENFSVSDNVTGNGRGIFVDKPMLRNKTGLVLQEEGNFSKEVKQALKKVFLKRLLTELNHNTEKKHVSAHLSYELPLPEEFLYSSVTVGNRTIKVTRNDTTHNNTAPEAPLRNCTSAPVSANQTGGGATTESPSAGAGSTSGMNSGEQAVPCSNPQNVTATSSATENPQPGSNGGPLTATTSNGPTASTTYNNTLSHDVAMSSGSTSFDDTSDSSNGQMGAFSDQSNRSSSSQSHGGSSSQSSYGLTSGSHNSDSFSDSKEIEIVNLIDGLEEVGKDKGDSGASSESKGGKGGGNKTKSSSGLVIKGDKKKVTSLFVKFLQDVAKKLKLDVLNVAEQLVSELEEEEKKAGVDEEDKKREVKSFSNTIPRRYLPVMTTLTESIEKDLDTAVQKMGRSK